jgi:hypothetical protein
VERFRLLGLYVVFIIVALACAIGAVAVHRAPSGARCLTRRLAASEVFCQTIPWGAEASCISRTSTPCTTDSGVLGV